MIRIAEPLPADDGPYEHRFDVGEERGTFYLFRKKPECPFFLSH